MMPFIERARTKESYGSLLGRLYGYYAPLEQLLVPFQQGWGINPIQHQKAQLILTDLQTLQYQALPEPCTQLPVVANAHQALGAWYVLEGAALGGRVIARMIRAHAALPAEAFHFLDSPDTGARWQQFQHLMNRLATTPAQMQQVAQAANDTFNTHTHWMQIS